MTAPTDTTENPPRVLVADDQAAIIDALRLLLSDEGFEVETARSPQQLVTAVESRDFDVVLMDLNYTRDTTSGREGLDLLPRLQSADGALPVVVMTAWGSVEGAVEAMRRGARDYVEKPWDDARLVHTLRTQVELGRALRRTMRLESENRALRRDASKSVEIIAESAAMQPVRRLMERVGPSDANVLVTGEHGTGKELVARWLHASSARAGKPLVIVNMGGLSEGVFESELFGHVKGAFTDAKADRVGRFELADTGTIFLDEIGNMSLSQQAKLLRVLQSREVERVGSSRPRRIDVRVISATNADLRAEVAAGRFREDLLYRLNTVEIHLPSLRERRDDVPLLAAHFLRLHAARYRKPLKGFDRDALQLLLSHPWPGNVRELDHAVERAVLMAVGDAVRATDFALYVDRGAGAALEEMTLEAVEKVLIQKALARWNGNVSHAAQALGLSRSALYRRMAQYGL
ncbi:sigma-54 factor interaction domain-containing protein [Gemmatirosa kalamazoonensis]|uniref:Sigma-54 factor interaction domain-containing protein n=1 Tax=Gemmatirosa kalamazoonensis TaxID=861299 RepID=W0R9P3_9BACT|nr:sigma-54 dependent transcriptional regulator [Gemmatirosa kalamazoonensis]AHG87814.1 sigma-54 factor interaction domain-containing protein [Gemmatirosa kalamazoonensis]